MGAWIKDVVAGLVRSWRRVEAKPARPDLAAVGAVEQEAAGEALQALTGASPVRARGGRRADEVALDPRILSNRVPPWPASRGPGELRVWTPARVAMRGGGEGIPPLVIDPTPQPPPERWALEVKELAIKDRVRQSPHWSRNGYRWPRYNDSAMESCRRQLLLRTDLARLKYPRLPSPGRLMRPMLEAAEGLEPWVPLGDQPRVEMTAEDLSWCRLTDLTIGAPALPRPRWRSALARGAEGSAPPPVEAPGPGEEPKGGDP